MGAADAHFFIHCVAHPKDGAEVAVCFWVYDSGTAVVGAEIVELAYGDAEEELAGWC